MFQLGNELWFSREMISDDESRLAFEGQAMEWLKEHGCFSVERLFEDFCGVLRHIDTPEVCAAFLRHLGFTVTAWGKGGHFCSLPSPNLDDSLAAISETIVGWLEEANGTLTFNEIEQAMPHLTAEALEGIRVHFLQEVHEAEVGGAPCWRSNESITLPEDFSEKLTTVVDTLVVLEEKVSTANLEFALNLFYCARFRKKYALQDNRAFMRVCAKHYQGGNDVFPNCERPPWPRRTHIPNLKVGGSLHRKPSNYEKPLGSKGNSNLEDYLIPVIRLMWSGLDHKAAFRNIARKLDVRYNTVSSQCTRSLDLTTDEFVRQVNSKSIVNLLERKYPNQYRQIKDELKPFS
jgi:hypothetical protein